MKATILLLLFAVYMTSCKNPSVENSNHSKALDSIRSDNDISNISDEQAILNKKEFRTIYAGLANSPSFRKFPKEWTMLTPTNHAAREFVINKSDDSENPRFEILFEEKDSIYIFRWFGPQDVSDYLIVEFIEQERSFILVMKYFTDINVVLTESSREETFSKWDVSREIIKWGDRDDYGFYTPTSKTSSYPVRKSQDLSFGFTYSVGDSVFIVGEHSLNTAVSLIDNKTGSVVECKTVGLKTQQAESQGEIILTRLACKSGKIKKANYIVDFSISSGDYSLENQVKISDKDKIRQIDSLIRETDYLNYLLKLTGDRVYSADELLKDKLPELVKVQAVGFEYIVASYKPFNGTLIGPRLIILQDNVVFPLTGQCSNSNFYAYFYNGKNYIQSGSMCCECEIANLQIFQVESDNISTVFEDYNSLASWE